MRSVMSSALGFLFGQCSLRKDPLQVRM
jgi:hypothetical protein